MQVILVICLAVTLQYLSNFMTKAAAKDDPIQLPQVLMLMVLFNDIQKVFFMTSMIVRGSDIAFSLKSQYMFTSNFRFTLLALEMVFIIIPLRHNLAPSNLEL